ncbi:MAG: ATP-binding cassette domain-containing protein [Alphaproteobacteria bacterium]|nr:ATP-binding cassette domain-containing protein [Alphaproteobacteria bacterium]
MAGSDWAVELEDVHLTLVSAAGPVNVLRGIDLAVAPGESVAVVGPSGSGKTSTLLVAAGLERATGGRVSVAGRDLGAMTEDELAILRREEVGIVFQSFHLMATMTALENVAVPLELSGRRDALERARACLEAVGLGARTGHYPGELSGGEQQRVAIARAFGPAPAAIFADEPTGNLDGETGRRALDALFGLATDGGTTLILVTHDPDLAARCGRQVRIEDGRIVNDAD